MTYRPRDIARALALACDGASEQEVRERAAYTARWLAAKGLASLLPDVLALLPDAIREAEGRQAVTVRSAHPLSEAALAELLSAAGIDAGRADIAASEDPGLVAGAVAETDSVRFDASLSGRLARLTSLHRTFR